jgi:hypothetical protein
MRSITTALATTAVLLGATAAFGGPERDHGEPPPGSAPGDATLWRELRHGTTWGLWHLARVSQASSRIRYGKYYEALDAAIRTAAAPEAGRARALRDQLTAAAEAAQQAIPADGGRVHPCRVTLRDLEQRIDPRNPRSRARRPRSARRRSAAPIA